MEYEGFYDDLKEANGVLRVTIPSKLCEFMGLKQGDTVKVMVKKVEEY